jgi:hypothetical protein
MMKDPFFHNERALNRLGQDKNIMAMAARLQWLKLASGLFALGLIAAIWIVWRWN